MRAVKVKRSVTNDEKRLNKNTNYYKSETSSKSNWSAMPIKGEINTLLNLKKKNNNLNNNYNNK